VRSAVLAAAAAAVGLLATSAAAQEVHSCRIDGFLKDERELEFSADRRMVVPVEGERFTIADTCVTLPPEQVLVRVKDDSGGYRLYVGKLSGTAFTPQFGLYTFDIPSWIPFCEFLFYKLYAERFGSYDADEGVVLFDSRRVYVQERPALFYYRDNSWFSLAGRRGKPTGAIELSSDPSGAAVALDGVGTGLRTPVTVTGLIAGKHDVELSLEEYRFTRKTVTVVEDTVVSASFKLVADLDTIFIREAGDYGVLILPEQPLDVPYLVDDETVGILQVRLTAGQHRVAWDGGRTHESIDTIVTIERGEVTYLDFTAQRLRGGLRVVALPPTALIWIDDSLEGVGELAISLPTGSHAVRGTQRGYDPSTAEVEVEDGEMSTVGLTLVKKPDRDEDGFLDSLDKCPDEYDGCGRPRIGDAWKFRLQGLWDYARVDPLVFGWSAIGYMRRIALNARFRDVVSRFDAGVGGGMNNFRGFTFGNSVVAQYRGFYCSVDLGQWGSGLRYRRSDTLYLPTERDVYAVFYDTLGRTGGEPVEPALFITSTAFSLGFHFPLRWLNVIYTLGYEWEDIVVDDIVRVSDGSRVRVMFDNDWWFHQIHFESNFMSDLHLFPSLYINFQLPFGRVKRVHWQVVHMGLMLKLRAGQNGHGRESSDEDDASTGG
jgi:hypothetical protein